MLIVEDFFLIAIDPRTGVTDWPRRELSGSILAAAAVILGLTLQQRLRLHADGVQADIQLPLAYPLLSAAANVLHAQPLPGLVALQTVVQRLAPLPQQVLEGLFRRDLVHRHHYRDWLLRKQVRYPLRSMQARNEAVQHLRDAVHRDNDDLHGLALLMLLDQCGLLPLHLRARDHERAMRRLLALDAVGAHAPETLRIFALIRAALLA